MDVSSGTAPAVENDIPKLPEPNQTDPVSLSNSQQVKTSSDTLRALTDSALDFLSHASNETLGAYAIGLCALTYLILGRVGLVLIGVFGGIVIHTTWEGPHENGDGIGSGLLKSGSRRKELGIEVAKRVLDWTDKRTEPRNGLEGEDTRVEASAATKPLNYSEFKPATGAALTSLTDAIIRDYVEWWYAPILPGESKFPLACRQTLSGFILSISNHLSEKRPADLFLDFLTNSSSIVIVFLNELSAALRAGQGQPPGDAIQQYLKEEPDSNLANVISKQQQERKLGLVADDILAKFLDEKAFDFLPSKTFLREILARLVLETAVKNCSRPEWINGWIVYLLEKGEPEIMNVTDSGVVSVESPIQHMPKSALQIDAAEDHARRVSKAEEAMQQAMSEAKRLSEMIAEEDARKKRTTPSIAENDDSFSAATTEGIATPTSSDSDRNRAQERSLDSSMVLQPGMDESPPQKATSSDANTFTDFDQLLHSETPTAQRTSLDSHPRTASSSAGGLTLHNAVVTIMDDDDSHEKAALRSKPVVDYLLQIELGSSRFPGWMIVRKYQDFETLHEVLRRISIISGVPQFSEKHAVLPTWKGQSKQYLRQNLERYLRDALRYEPLAESEAMKKFLEKETGLEKTPSSNKGVFPFQGPAALETMGKGFVNVLGQAPKGLAGGGKAVLGGVQGVFGAVGSGLKKPAPEMRKTSKSASVTSPSRSERLGSENASEESLPATPIPVEIQETHSTASRPSIDAKLHTSPPSPARSQATQSIENLRLPPLPSEITDDYAQPPKPPTHAKTYSTSHAATSVEQSTSTSPASAEPLRPEPFRTNTGYSIRPNKRPITEEEARVSIELIFAIITELYSLSSAWTIRLSLLAAAKTFLLRPNNPQLESIRLLLQDSIIDANFLSDTGLASHILKLRENTLPTEEELKKWPPEMTADEKKKLMVKARKLLVEKGMPQALTSVMGSAASGEALGRVFDCLQVEGVARGLIFALLLQAVKVTTQ